MSMSSTVDIKAPDEKGIVKLTVILIRELVRGYDSHTPYLL